MTYTSSSTHLEADRKERARPWKTDGDHTGLLARSLFTVDEVESAPLLLRSG